MLITKLKVTLESSTSDETVIAHEENDRETDSKMRLRLISNHVTWLLLLLVQRYINEDEAEF